MNWYTVLFAATVAAWMGVWVRRSLVGLADASDTPVGSMRQWPEVVAIVPARDETAVIARSLGSLLAQDYPGAFRIVLVDDESSDGTADLARATAGVDRPSRPSLDILRAGPRPPGWTGKLWAVSRGIAAAGEPRWLWLTDADIEHTPETLRALVLDAERDRLVLNSRMALLRTENAAERAVVPAFVYFFDMLYPFARVGNPRSRIAAAAGGCMLVRRATLADAGGVDAIRGALIDDVAMATLMKWHGPIRLSLTRATRSLRAYDLRELSRMIARSAFAQLHFSPMLLIVSVVSMSILFGGPVLLLFSPIWKTILFLFGLMSPFATVLHVYRLSFLRFLSLPLIATFFTAATIASAVQHWRGRGGMWKGRAQAMRRA